MPSIFYVLARWSPTGNDASPYGIFWTSFMALGMNSCTPIVTLSLTIERIMYISEPLAKNGYKSRLLTAITVVAIAICFGFNVASVFQVLPFTANVEGCLVFACLLTNTSGLIYTYTKICCGFLNLLAGAIFLIKWRYSKNSRAESLGSAQLERNRIVNRIAVLVISLELGLNFTPQLTALILFQIFGIVVGSYVGSYNFMGCCFDIFISSSIYSWRLHRSPASGANISFVRASNS